MVVLPFRRSTRGPLGAIGWLLVPPLGQGELKFPSAPLHFHVKFPKFPSELVWTEVSFHDFSAFSPDLGQVPINSEIRILL